MPIVLYLVFGLSGAAGLIYESIWSRYLGLFVGHSAYAQMIVLAIFLGGMSLGALAVGQRSERLKEPLLWYAGAELVIGVLGGVFHPVYVAVTQAAYAVVLPALPNATALLIAKWSIASLLILPQAILLGATFPFMSAGVLRLQAGQPGRVLALLYCVNSLGAAVGVVVAGFYLIAHMGLPGTVLTAAGCNVLAALGVLVVVRCRRAPGSTTREAWLPDGDHNPVWSSPSALRPVPPWRLLLLVSFATAVASFIYEIAWIRMLSLVLGSATHAFELMLSAFIVGLAWGAMWVRQRADRFREPLRTLAWVQWAMGCLALLTLPIYLASFQWMAVFIDMFDRTDAGYMGFNLARYGLCLAVMLPATFCAGTTLPLITKILVTSGQGERAIGWVYGINTLGSIAGVVLAGLLLLPWVGLKALLIVGAACDMALGVLLWAAGGARPGAGRLGAPLTIGGATVLVVILVAWHTPFDPIIMTSGVFRHGFLPRAGARELLFYRDGRTATVSATRSMQDDIILLATNGKPDASLPGEWFREPDANKPLVPLRGDAATQVLLALVTLAHVPQARTAAVIGHGSGQSSHMLLASPTLERLVTIEIEPEMIAGSRVFYPANRRVFEDPRAVFAIDDARSFFATQSQQYDLILSEPSNPWVSGVSSLFTAEFYARLVPQLSPQGIFGQWVQLYELNDDLVASVLAALHRHFTSYQIFLVGNSDLLIVASTMPTLPPPDWSVFAWPTVIDSLQPFIPLTPDDLEAMRLLDRAALSPLLDSWKEYNSDFFPTLDLGAEQARYMGTSARGFLGLRTDRVNMVAPLFGRHVPLSTHRVVSVYSHPLLKARALSASLRAWRTQGALPGANSDDTVREAVQRLWQWTAALSTDLPPADWQAWLRETLQVEADLHSGAAGVADEAFYTALHRYLERRHPPAAVCDAVLFREGLARWDFAAVASAAEGLLESVRDGQGWIDADHFRDGAVLAKLFLGDVTGARYYFVTLASQVERSERDLRTRLLEAYMRDPEKLPERPPLTARVPWTCSTRWAPPAPEQQR